MAIGYSHIYLNEKEEIADDISRIIRAILGALGLKQVSEDSTFTIINHLPPASVHLKAFGGDLVLHVGDPILGH